MVPYTHPDLMDVSRHFMGDEEARRFRDHVYRELDLHQQRPFGQPPDTYPLQRHYVHDRAEERDSPFWRPGFLNPPPYVEHVAPAFPMPSMAIPEHEHLPAPPFTLAQPQPHHPQNPRRPDDVDSSCRPRLSTQQTSHLEDMYLRNTRPTTNEKKAIAQHLCLPQDKVNASLPDQNLHAILADMPLRTGFKIEEQNRNNKTSPTNPSNSTVHLKTLLMRRSSQL